MPNSKSDIKQISGIFPEYLHNLGYEINIEFNDCNLTCLYCDKVFSKETVNLISSEEILNQVQELPGNSILISGGEPLIATKEITELSKLLTKNGYSVTVKTNCYYPVYSLDEELTFLIEVKTPGSGMSGITNFENLRLAKKKKDKFIFRVTSEADLKWVENLIKKHKLKKKWEVTIVQLENV